MALEHFAPMPKRKGAKVKYWGFPNVEQWKALRWSQDAGCPEDHLSLEESKSLAMTVMGRPGSTWTSAQVLEHGSSASVVDSGHSYKAAGIACYYCRESRQPPVSPPEVGRLAMCQCNRVGRNLVEPLDHCSYVAATWRQGLDMSCWVTTTLCWTWARHCDGSSFGCLSLRRCQHSLEWKAKHRHWQTQEPGLAQAAVRVVSSWGTTSPQECEWAPVEDWDGFGGSPKHGPGSCRCAAAGGAGRWWCKVWAWIRVTSLEPWLWTHEPWSQVTPCSWWPWSWITTLIWDHDFPLSLFLSLSLPLPRESQVKAEPASSSTTTRVKAEPVEPKVKAEPRTRSDQRSKGPHSPMPLSPGQRNKKLLEVMSKQAAKAKAKAKAKGTAGKKKTLGSRVK